MSEQIGIGAGPNGGYYMSRKDADEVDKVWFRIATREQATDWEHLAWIIAEYTGPDGYTTSKGFVIVNERPEAKELPRVSLNLLTIRSRYATGRIRKALKLPAGSKFHTVVFNPF